MKKIVVAGLLVAAATTANAADLPRSKSPPPAPMIYAPSFTWTGFYLGVSGGLALRDMYHSSFSNQTGGIFGVTGGYNYQIGNFVGGIESDLNWAETGKRAGYVNGVNNYFTNTLVTARLRAGYTIMDRTLLYITGGYAGVQAKGSFNDVVLAPGFSGSQSGWNSGGVIGGGVEYAITNNITAKAEYLWAPMGSKTYFAGTPDAEKSNLDLSLFRVGLNYKF